jgi:two-component system, NtrC family, response regulator HydG
MKPDECFLYWESVVNTMDDGLLIVDTEGTVMFINPAAENMTGYKKEEVVGLPCTVFESDTCMLSTPQGTVKRCNLFEQGIVTRKRCMVKRKDGSGVYLLKNATVLRNVQGEVIGGVETLTDITQLLKKDQEIEFLKKELTQENGFHGLIGNSTVMQQVFDLIKNAAESEAPVVILGESGTGKELVASAIHRLSQRRKGPFIKVNCASLNESLLESELFGHVKGAFTGADRNRIGRFEAANRGSIFLDEIGDIPPAVQVKLLRVVQEKEIERVGSHEPIGVDVRLVSATNKDLRGLVEAGHFREDLYYRLNVIPIGIPPLRERKEDIPWLTEAMIRKIALRSQRPIQGLHPEAMELVINYTWPGNVRELINVLEYAFVVCKEKWIKPEHLPGYLNQRPERVQGREFHKQKISLEEPEKIQLQKALDHAGGKKSLAAQALGISRVTLWKKMKRYGLGATT